MTILFRNDNSVPCWALVCLLFIFAFTSPNDCQSISPEVEDLIYSWAPLIYLHSEEEFFPSSVEFYLPEVTIQDENGVTVQENVTPDSILGGDSTSSLHMQTREALECPTCTNLEVLYGQKRLLANAGIPVYVIYREHGDPANTLDVIYHTFYPYNRGKDACVGLPVNGSCVGNPNNFGNHVGDWEHNTIRFVGGKPSEMYVSVHSFGAFYSWNETTRNFHLTYGEPVRSTRGDENPGDAKYTPDYPLTVEVIDGTTPVVYSANGSHGLWSGQGEHIYLPALEDYTDAGYPWFTWENLVIIPWQPPPYSYEGNLAWINFRGDWGNSKDGCQLEFLTGQCELGSGPSGIPKDGDFSGP